MRGIKGHLWMEDRIEEAVDHYVSLFPGASIDDRLFYNEAGQEIHGHEPGSPMTIDFTIAGRSLVALEGGPYVKMNPSVSLAIDCPSRAEADRMWEALSPDANVHMDLGEYEWSPHYAWLDDRFGTSWQISYGGDQAPAELTVTPVILFTGEVLGRAEEAINFWTGVFPDSGLGPIFHFEGDERRSSVDKPLVLWAEFTLAGEKYRVMESPQEHAFEFNDAFSFLVEVEDEAENDRYWEALSGGVSEGPCGWLKDRFGLAWQVAPIRLQEMLRDGTPEQAVRVTDCFMKMPKKLNLPELEAAFRGD